MVGHWIAALNRVTWGPKDTKEKYILTDLMQLLIDLRLGRKHNHQIPMADASQSAAAPVADMVRFACICVAVDCLKREVGMTVKDAIHKMEDRSESLNFDTSLARKRRELKRYLGFDKNEKQPNRLTDGWNSAVGVYLHKDCNISLSIERGAEPLEAAYHHLGFEELLKHIKNSDQV